MITFNNVAELEAALRAAEKAHHAAELNGTSTAAHWPEFYALHMLQHCPACSDIMPAGQTA